MGYAKAAFTEEKYIYIALNAYGRKSERLKINESARFSAQETEEEIGSERERK